MKRYCSRTLDKPILMFGLEPEDVALIALCVGLGSLTFGPTIPGLLGAGLWIGLMNFKKDKPEGYIIHLLYTFGVDLPGLIPPLNKVKQYGL